MKQKSCPKCNSYSLTSNKVKIVEAGFTLGFVCLIFVFVFVPLFIVMPFAMAVCFILAIFIPRKYICRGCKYQFKKEELE